MEKETGPDRVLNPTTIAREAWERGMPFFVPESIKYLENMARPEWKAFEWGSGASTIWCGRKFERTISVEHSLFWFDRVAQRLEEENISTVDLLLISLDDGYAEKIREYPDIHFDLVMVDGRHRMQCVKEAVSKVKHLLVLDNSEREWYTPAIRLLDDWERIDFGVCKWQTSVFRR